MLLLSSRWSNKTKIKSVCSIQHCWGVKIEKSNIVSPHIIHLTNDYCYGFTQLLNVGQTHHKTHKKNAKMKRHKVTLQLFWTKQIQTLIFTNEFHLFLLLLYVCEFLKPFIYYKITFLGNCNHFVFFDL